MMLSRRGLLGGLPLVVAGAARADSAPVRIYAAVTFRAALDPVLAAYRQAGGAAVAIYAPTPLLIRQLAGGAAADILMSADPDWMDEAVRQGLVQAGTRVDLMTNDLVLAGPPGTPAAGTITRGFGIGALLAGGRLAMCDPAHHPAGRYGKQSLRSLGLWQTVEPHIAIAESAPAAIVLVDRGEARAAIAFKTDLHGDDKAVIVGRFAPESHAPILYPAALTRGARNPQAAQALAFLHGPAARRIFAGFGYKVPAE
ncbi:molybdate ABC transporter substrate-binding protein [Rhodopila globiformis]|nr:molybdate ABC transporter substrate-binding protein [Rhodopila globiformis]